MKSSYSVAKGGNRVSELVRAAQHAGVVAVTKDDETVAYVLSRERLEGIFETIELLANPAFVREWRREKAGKVKYQPLAALGD